MFLCLVQESAFIVECLSSWGIKGKSNFVMSNDADGMLKSHSDNGRCKMKRGTERPEA